MRDPVEAYRNYETRPRPTNDLADHPAVKGFEPDKDLLASELLERMGSIGFQASHLANALEVIKAMRREKALVFLAYTGNLVTSGLRDVIRYLVQHKYVDVLVTNAGGIEEDVIKCFKPFKLGSFNVPGKVLHEQGIHRTGNIFIPTDRYTEFDKFIQPFFDRMFPARNGITVHEMLKELGLFLNHDESILTWAARNDIPVFCPAINDGAFGDMLYFRTHGNKEISLDIAWENKKIIDLALNAERTGAIVLGSGVAKHYALNSNILREGLDYAVFINTAQEFDGSDSGARPDEAVTWQKIKPNGMSVKVWCDATIAFPLLVSAWMAWERAR